MPRSAPLTVTMTEEQLVTIGAAFILAFAKGGSDDKEAVVIFDKLLAFSREVEAGTSTELDLR